MRWVRVSRTLTGQLGCVLSLGCAGKVGSDAGFGGEPRERPASERFHGLACSGNNFCAVREGAIYCWGGEPLVERSPFRPESGDYVRVFPGEGTACAERSDASVVCWGGAERLIVEIPELAAALSPPPRQIRPLRTRAFGEDESSTTERNDVQVYLVTQDGSFNWYSMNLASSDSVRFTEEMDCFREPVPVRELAMEGTCLGIDFSGSIRGDAVLFGGEPPPVGSYRSLTRDAGLICAIRDDDELVCWRMMPGESEWIDRWPRERVRAVGMGNVQGCVIRENGFLYCWRDENLRGYVDAPDEKMSELCVQDDTACGITEKDGAIRCWGRDDEFTVPPPELEDR